MNGGTKPIMLNFEKLNATNVHPRDRYATVRLFMITLKLEQPV